MELFVIVNALAGIATFLGVRFVWRRSKDVTKRGFDVIHDRKEEELEEWTSSDPQSLPSGTENSPGSQEQFSQPERSLSSRP